MNTYDFYTFRFYYQSLGKLLFDPPLFFRRHIEAPSQLRSVVFLLYSTAFFIAGAALVRQPREWMLFVTVLFVNAVGMTVIFASVGYLLAGMITKIRMPFSRVFSIYAYASGAVLLFAWIPGSGWLTEVWRWVLISSGLVHGCGLKGYQAAMVISATIFSAVFLVQYMVPAG